MNKPKPKVTIDSKEFWEGCSNRKLLYQKCKNCGHHQMYPRQHCTKCSSKTLTWQQSSGIGEVYSYTCIHRAPNDAFKNDVPYILALIELEEGFRILSNILNVSPEKVRIGTKVRVEFEKRGEDLWIPQFSPL